MKNLLLISLLALFSLGNISAQEVKLGHINTQELMASLPKKVAAEAELKKYADELETFRASLQEELTKKYEDYLTQRDSYTDLVKATKEKELQDLQQRLGTYEKTAQQDLRQKESELLQPIVEEVRKAIEEVGEENGFLYIFDTSSGNLLFQSNESIDITPLVRKKLGLEN